MINDGKYEKFAGKTEDWLSVNDLRKRGIINAEASEIRSALRQYQNDMPDYIKLKRSRNFSGLCLFNDSQIIERFCNLAGFNTTQSNKSSAWLSAKDLENTYICASAKVIGDYVYILQSDMPKYIQARIRNIDGQDHRDLCLFGNPLVIRAFCVKAGLLQPNDIGPQQDEWLPIGELCAHLQCKATEILSVATKYPNDIKFQNMLCVRNDPKVIEELRRKVGSELTQSHKKEGAESTRARKVEDWVSVSALIKQKLVHGTMQKITDAIKEYQRTNPEDVQEKMRGKGVSYCLRNDSVVINQFNKFYKESKQNVKAEWLGVSLLLGQKFVSGGYRKIESALKNWQENNPDDVLTKMRGEGTTYCLRNDSVVIDRFKESLKQKEWVSATVLVRQKLVSGTLQKIVGALEKYRLTNPDDVREKMFKGQTILCLRNTPDVIKRFKESLGVKRAESSVDLSGQWLSAKDLEYQYVDAGYTAIYDKLCALQSCMPDLIQRRDTNQGQKLCLKSTAIQTFCQHAKFNQITAKTSLWLSATDLITEKYVPWRYKEVKNILRLNKPYKREYVQTKINSKGQMVICLLNDANAITWFRKKLGLSPMSFSDEASRWILIDQLPEKYIAATKEKIKQMLEEVSDIMRDDIWFVPHKDKQKEELYLRVDALADFCQKTGLKTVADIEKSTAAVVAQINLAHVNSRQKS